jgi:hypothetical protein
MSWRPTTCPLQSSTPVSASVSQQPIDVGATWLLTVHCCWERRHV